MKKRNFLEYPFEIQLFSEGDESGESMSADAGHTSSAECDTDTDNEFAALIKGKYKDAFGRKTQSIINRRFKETKELQEYKQKAEPVLSFLREKYGDTVDAEELLSKMKGEAEKAAEDSAEVAENTAAAEDGAEVAVNESPDDEKARRVELAKAQYARWQREALELKSLYPDFNLEAECRNGEFLALLAGGATVKGAYHAVHHDSIMKSAMEYTAKTVSEAISRNAAKTAARPFENGLSPRGAISPVRDVNSLTDSDIAEILKEVSKGKVIRF